MIVTNYNISDMYKLYNEELYNIILAFDKDRANYGFSCKQHLLDQYRLAFGLALYIKDLIQYTSISFSQLSAKLSLDTISDTLYCNGISLFEILEYYGIKDDNLGGIENMEINSTFIIEPELISNVIIKDIQTLRINKTCTYDLN